jgi:tetratricopeptide (TPR) repeat protein
MAERLMYLPSLGIIAVVVIGLWRLAERLRIPRAVPIALAVAVAMALSLRTWKRNADWKNDVTLWSAAVNVSPQSAKAHRALAEALYDADATHSQLDRAIQEAERSAAIVSSLPDNLKPSQSYRQVAAYHLDRGERIRAATAGIESSEAGRAFQRALDAGRQCLTIIEASRARIPGGSTAPAADAHRLLAAAYLGLHQPQRALDEAQAALALSPTHALPYRQIAAASLDLGRPDEAVIALMTGLVATGDPGFNRDVSGLYRAGLDAEGCAVKGTASEPLLDPSCPIVRRHLCAGYARAIVALPARADARIASLCRME